MVLFVAPRGSDSQHRDSARVDRRGQHDDDGGGGNRMDRSGDFDSGVSGHDGDPADLPHRQRERVWLASFIIFVKS